MTFKEKFLKDHPENANDIEAIIDNTCPFCSDDKKESARKMDILEKMNQEFRDQKLSEDAVNEALKNVTPEWKLKAKYTSYDNAPRILDSGNRRQFESGAVRDIQEGKGRMDLLPWGAIMEIAKHCENGANKYGEHNVDKGIPTHSLCDSAARHLAKYLDGWEDEPHLLAAAWNLLWALQMTLKRPDVVDTPWKER